MIAALALWLFPPPQGTSDLGSLHEIREARSRRVSSTADHDPSNRDNVWVRPGETQVLADIAGPGVIRHIWLTFAEARPNWLAEEGAANPSEIALRMYWDGASEPAVEAPLGDFFAAGFGKRAQVVSAPVIVQGGDAYNCYWPMPFFRSARIEITNESEKPLAALYYVIDYTEEPVGEGAAYFCAQYRQEFPAAVGVDYLILEAEGAGHYVGTVMSVRTRSPEWFGEGDEKFTIDGEAAPSIRGTGTEDYFGNAWGLEKGTFPHFGVPILEGEWGHVGQRLTSYRWHVLDPVRFSRSLRVEIEHWGWMSADETRSGKVEGFVEREDDFATVAFWYQRGQPKRFVEMPHAKERVFPSLDVVTEGKDLLPTAKTTLGTVALQKGWEWTGEGQLFFDGESQGAALEFAFEVGEEALKRLVLPLTHSYDFGVYRILLDGKLALGPLDLYSSEIVVREHSLGDLVLAKGRHKIRLECVGKHPLSTGFKAGVDSIRLRQRFAKR